jgi:hypothetical protein
LELAQVRNCCQVSFFVLMRRGAELNVSRSTAARLDNLISWFAASAVVTAGVLYALKRQENRISRVPAYVPPRATPAQEPIDLQRLRAAETGRGRRAAAPTQIPPAR